MLGILRGDYELIVGDNKLLRWNIDIGERNFV